MSEIARYPLTWPNYVNRTPYHNRSRPKFEASSLSASINFLRSEINRMNGRPHDQWDDTVIISSNLKRDNEGKIFQQPEPKDTGVAVYFTLIFRRFAGGQVKEIERSCVLTCDKWNRVVYNIDAIARDIEAQRARYRWGCTTIEQAMQGYLAIPEKCGGRAWWDVLKIPQAATKDQIKIAFKELSKTAHPDRGGSHLQWIELQDAYNQAMEQ
jgi:hypothetical protein